MPKLDQIPLDIPQFNYRSYSKPEIKKLKRKDELNWGLKLSRVDKLWPYTQGEGVKVAILDSGYVDHPDLKGVKIKTGYSSIFQDSIDRNGHGTHIAGIIASQLNGIGYAGIAPKVELFIYKVFEGLGTYQSLKDGIQWAISNDVDIMNLSLSSKTPSSLIHDAIKEAESKGIVIVASAGNFNDRIEYPGKYEETINVGSINRFLSPKAENRKNLDFVAPGAGIVSTFLDNEYAELTGASMATPHVAGLVALLISLLKINRDSSRRKVVKELLKSCVLDIGKFGRDKSYGFGIIDPSQFVIERVKQLRINLK